MSKLMHSSECTSRLGTASDDGMSELRVAGSRPPDSSAVQLTAVKLIQDAPNRISV